MADPITREQVERAIEQAQMGHFVSMPMHFGPEWRCVIPAYVRTGYDISFTELVAALTRWHAELVAAETAKAPDDTAPERLRERREALGWHRARAADGMPLLWHDIERLETGRTDEDAADRARYAAALSAAEAERAAKPDHLAYADSPVWDDGPMPKPVPATEVVDVPQPAPLPKTVAHFYTIRALPEPHRVSWNMPGDGPQWVRVNDALWLHVDDIRAMLADIDAQRQPDPQPDLDEGWRVVNGDTAFAMPFGTIRECNGCGCLVSGGPTACQRCADAPGPQPGPEAPTRPEPRYKVGDWVRHGGGMPWQVTEVRDYRDCYAYHGALGVFIEGPEVTLSPALDLALHETARTAVAMLHKGEWPLDVPRVEDLPGFDEWNSGGMRSPSWAAQLERLLGDAP